jgi:CMP-N,N'-diacetyllegionaminic acid synthase
VSDVLAVIPARGGSKGVRRKNLVTIAGAPLVAHSIRHALASKLVTRVLVSTEDEEIAEVARREGAEVPFLRPMELALDHVLDWPVFEHVLTALAEREDYRPDTIVHLRPTAPRREPAWIDACIELLAARADADSVRSVSKVDQHPYRVFRIDAASGLLDPIMKHEHPQPYLLRRQELPPLYYYNCVIDVTRRATILKQKSMTGDRICPYEMDPSDVLDIDTPRDLEIARFLMEAAR